jgi:putative heme-binding domain-containing protein
MPRRSLFPLALALFTIHSLAQETPNPFAQLVRPTDPLPPAKQAASFHLPAGFAIQLVASEPDLRKPMNMQWDALGRLWITESREYPFAIKDGSPGRDTVRIFSDFGPDGRARKVEVFADGLNIPTGLYPFRSPDAQGRVTWKCIVWSIPNIWLMEDTDGDGKADRREVLVGPLGWERDTHGNLSSYRRGADGWIYGTHGFNNQSTLKGKDGSELQIQSGNTWRIRLDGSRVEGHTFGQVNPFGLCWDDRGNLYSADCHSSPIYQLLRGAYYPSFGKPNDGLGFAPQTILHSHGSTAICGPLYLSDPSWPAEFQNHMLVGNVQTSRLNHDLIEWHGSSSKGRELPDFLSTDDPWFRPVDLSWGPDGALYVADFYNKIIGHYEVPLTHPERDRERGRLWRIVHLDARNQAPLPPAALPQDTAGLVLELASTNPTRRTLALNELCDRIGASAVIPLKAALNKPVNALQKLHAVWALHRLGSLEEAALLQALADKDPLVRTHAARTASEVRPWSAALTVALQNLTRDPDALVQRCAAEALGTHPAKDHIPRLLTLLNSVPQNDDHLLHSARIALREQVRSFTTDDAPMLENLPKDDLHRFALDVFLGVPGEQSASLRLRLFQKPGLLSDAVFTKHIAHLSKGLPSAQLPALVSLSTQRLNETTPSPEQFTALKDLAAGLAERSPEAAATLTTWAKTAVPSALAAGGESVGTAVEIAASLKIAEALPGVRAVLADAKASPETKAKAVMTLVRLETSPVAALRPVLLDASAPALVREKVAAAFGDMPSTEARTVLTAAFKGSSHGFQRILATALSASTEGAALLLNACTDGTAAPSLLLEKRLSEKLLAHKQPQLTEKLEQLTGSLPPLNVALDKLIVDRSKAFNPAKADARHGLEVFTQTCAACHAIDGKGGNIGPQLDGIGGRGATRLLEDILDPSRNVDKAFRLTMATKKDGAVISGMLRREEAGQIILVDLAGQEIRLQQSEVSARKETETSLMPPNFAELLSEPQLNDLLAFLLSKAAAK